MRYEGTYRQLDQAAADELVITLAEAKAQCRLTASYTDEDTWFTNAILAAQDIFDQHTWRYINPQPIEMTLEAWPEDKIIYVYRGPFYQITTLKYYDTDGTLQTLVEGTDYNYDIWNEIGRIKMITTPGLDKDRLNRIVIEYTTRWNEDQVPRAVKSGLLLLVRGLYDNRGDQIIGERVSMAKVDLNSDKIFDRYKIRA